MAFQLAKNVLVPLLETKLNEHFQKMQVLPIDLKKFSLAPPSEQKIYQVTLREDYNRRFKNYSLIFEIQRNFIPEHPPFKGQFLIEIRVDSGEIFKTFEMYRFQKEKLIPEEIITIKEVLKEIFDSFSEGEF
ncbi:MAG: hypothetical protein N2692_01035 [Patescibacteria group bacterium]|jgi:hypothetical protein|nr:hypothetical protein [Patescibacteria group bacterium]